MKPYIHAQLSVRKYGGKEADYQKIHDWFDQTKAHHADMRHRAILHNAWGIFLCESVFGTCIINSDDNVVQVRDIAEDHVLQDLGRIPALTEMLSLIPIESIDKLARPATKKRVISLDSLSQDSPSDLTNFDAKKYIVDDEIPNGGIVDVDEDDPLNTLLD